MDSSITRRGLPCWYRSEGASLTAINDALLLEASVYWLLKKHLREDPSYVNLVELFHEVSTRPCSYRSHILTDGKTSFQTEIGQLLDLITAPEDKVDLSKFSLSK